MFPTDNGFQLPGRHVRMHKVSPRRMGRMSMSRLSPWTSANEWQMKLLLELEEPHTANHACSRVHAASYIPPSL